MALSLKNAKTEALAHELSKLTNETLTQAVTIALEERLRRLRAVDKTSAIASALAEISARCGKLPELDCRSAEDIIGYDDKGLPPGDRKI